MKKTLSKSSAKNDKKIMMNLEMAGDSVPLLRVLLILRKFKVGIERLEVASAKNRKGFWKARFDLDFSHAPRTTTVFKKIERLYDVVKIIYK